MRSYKCLDNQVFSSGNYKIVPLRDEDKYVIMQWRNEQIYHLRQNKPLTKKVQEKYFQETIPTLFEKEQPNQILFSYLENDVCIGYGGLVHINWVDKHAEISFIINTALEKELFEFHWLTYLSLIEQVAFEAIGFHKIFVFAFDLRPHLYQVVEKGGFIKEARLKEHYFWEGRFIDAVIHSKIKTPKLRICLLVSGKLGYESLIKMAQTENIVAIFTDKHSDSIIKFAEDNQTPLFVGNPRGGKASDFVDTLKCDLVLSINYLFIIEEDIIALPQKWAINIHGSLLPKYRGRTPHVWAIINNEKETGITAHLITKAVDNGDILVQKSVPIDDNDTGATVLEKYIALYPTIIDEILRGVKTNTLLPIAQNEAHATYYGKRTPDDGQINWDWHTERIRNWVRAQAKPYPGAFGWYNHQKVIIHKAQTSDLGFDGALINGTILQKNTDNIVVKVPNGSLILSEIEDFDSHNFDINSVLSS